MVLHDPAVQRKVLQDGVGSIIEEASEWEVEGLRRHVEAHIININEASED